MTRSIPSGRAMVDRETVHIHDVLAPESSAEFADSFRTVRFELFWSRHYFAKGLRSAQFMSGDRRFDLLRKSRSRCSKPSPTRR